MEQKSTLEAFVVKRRKILLPQIYGLRGLGISGWRDATRKIVSKEILVESENKDIFEYYLYGTDIPVTFCYPHYLDMTNPPLETCIGVETRQWEVSRSMKRANNENNPNEKQPFYYRGKRITDEEVIKWLENENNIESMKRVKEWAIQYGKECEELKRHQEQLMAESRAISEKVRKETLEKVEEKEKIMKKTRDNLVSQYN